MRAPVQIGGHKHQTDCERCGFTYVVWDRHFYRSETWMFCDACKAKPVKSIMYNGECCYPWKGEFDLDDNPINEAGELHRPGHRTCGHRDCVNRTHIMSAERVG
jgi:hypothetical protein